MYPTRPEQRSLEEKKDLILYMFEEDWEMIKKWAKEPSDKRPNGGYLFGLWTNTLNPVVHIVSFEDRVPTEDYLFVKSLPHEKALARHMYSKIGFWSFKKQCFQTMQRRFQDQSFVFLEVEVTHSIEFHPVLLFKEQHIRGRIELLKGKNPFRRLQEASSAQEAEDLKEEKEEGIVASLRNKFESGLTTVKNMVHGNTQKSTVQTSTVEQSHQHKQSTKVSSSASDFSEMPTNNTSFPSQYERRDVSTCTKGNQWYLTENGQKVLQEISDKLGEVINEKPKISRDEDTHNVMILFSFQSKKCVISFPPNFPCLNAELYHSMQTGNKRGLASPSMLVEWDPPRLVQEVLTLCTKD